MGEGFRACLPSSEFAASLFPPWYPLVRTGALQSVTGGCPQCPPLPTLISLCSLSPTRGYSSSALLKPWLGQMHSEYCSWRLTHEASVSPLSREIYLTGGFPAVRAWLLFLSVLFSDGISLAGPGWPAWDSLQIPGLPQTCRAPPMHAPHMQGLQV